MRYRIYIISFSQRCVFIQQLQHSQQSYSDAFIMIIRLQFSSISSLKIVKFEIDYNNIMEEYQQQNIQLTTEDENTLLSYKMASLKVQNYAKSPISTMILQKNKQFQKNATLTTKKSSINRSNRKYSNSLDLHVKAKRQLNRTSLPVNQSFLKRQWKSSLNKYHKNKQKEQQERDDPEVIKFIKSFVYFEERTQIMLKEQITSIFDIQGKGFVLTLDGRVIQGQWQAGVPRGPLKIKYPGNFTYEGEVYQFQRHGLGTLIYPNRARYTGNFSHGNPHGLGVYYDTNGKKKKEGYWRRGRFIG